MNKFGTVKFSGKSGTRYPFTAYPLETVFARGFSGVFVVTQRKPGKPGSRFVHRKISTGQSNGLCHPLAGEEGSFTERGANCICVHAEKDKAARQTIAQDLTRRPRPGTA